MTSLSAVFKVQREAWMSQGACKGEDPNIFILDQGYTSAEAIKFCRVCTVRAECAAYARRTGSTGVWGGKLFTQRYTNPVELLPIQTLQDARPRKSISHTSLSRVPGILGQASSFGRPGILG